MIFDKKMKIDKIVKIIFLILALICSSTIIFIVLFIFIKGIQPFISDYMADNKEIVKVPFINFLLGTTWSNHNYGILGITINTIYLVFISSIFALTLSVLTALFIVRIAHKKLSIIMQSIVELLASIPSIVFGLFGQGVICPMIRDIGEALGIQTMGGASGLAVIIVLVMMMIPTITLVSISSMKAIKEDQIKASLALGATKAQTDFKVVVAGAKSGIFAALILGVGRALGEATAISMVCGSPVEGPVFNLFNVTRTLTSTMMLGLHDTNGIDYDIRFSVGIVLIIVILITNIGLNIIKKRMESR